MNAERRLAAVHLRDERLVVRVDVAARVALDPFEPLHRARLAVACAATAVTIGWKSVSVGASASLPFHFGCARSRIDFGSCDGLSLSVL